VRRLLASVTVLLALSLPGVARAQQSHTIVRVGAYINDVQQDETVLVVGAPGGVGSFFVQLAVAAGAKGIAPALPEDDDYLRDLGVSDRVDRNGTRPKRSARWIRRASPRSWMSSDRRPTPPC
jgi:NADPH:quinone reductase-like Zn-dependent oxidoreductase